MIEKIRAYNCHGASVEVEKEVWEEHLRKLRARRVPSKKKKELRDVKRKSDAKKDRLYYAKHVPSMPEEV